MPVFLFLFQQNVRKSIGAKKNNSRRAAALLAERTRANPGSNIADSRDGKDFLQWWDTHLLLSYSDVEKKWQGSLQATWNSFKGCKQGGLFVLNYRAREHSARCLVRVGQGGQ